MTTKKTARSTSIIVRFFLSFLFLYLLIKSIIFIFSGVSLISQDRVNVAFYNQRPFVLSFGLSDNVNYIMDVDNNIEILVPGGYERYKIGSLGKLSRLEKNPELMRTAFSSMLSTNVDFYYLPKSVEVYDRLDESAGHDFSKSAFISTIFSRAHFSNTNFFDKLYLSYLLINHRKQDFIALSPGLSPDLHGKYNFSEAAFAKKTKGFFFQKSFREEGAEVKLYYQSYSAATNLSRIIEGSGIRIVDLESTDKLEEKCLLVVDSEQGERYRHTTNFFKKTYNCVIKEGRVQGAGIAVYLGKEVEQAWE